jgi:imidazolonepropionase-like amidohydrolase
LPTCKTNILLLRLLQIKTIMNYEKLSRSFVICTSVLTIFLSAFPQAVLAAQQGSQPIVEEGKFRLHKFEQPIGEESYAITRDGDSLVVKIDFKFTDRSTEVPLSATFRGASDLTPRSFEIKGKTSRLSTIDEAIEIQADKVRLRNREQWTDLAAPPQQFFTIAGYAPATMQMLMVRYWAAHGSPVDLPALPSGTIKIEARGADSITVNGKTETLDRYIVEGLIWGRETLWFNAHRDLIAVVTLDAEFDHFEAVREGYDSALSTLVARAGTDEMAALATISKQVSADSAEITALVGGTLIDGTGRAALPDSAVVFEKGKIIAAGPRAKVKIPKHAAVINVSGKTILPGLWDMHAHFEQVEWGPIYLAAGVTTARDCGNEFEFITAVRDAIDAGHGLGPHLLLAGIVDGTGPSALGMQRVDTPEQARLWVDRYHAAGFQQMKIYSSVKLEQVKAVADEAHRLGMTVTGHVPIGLNAFQTIDAGQDQINHISYIADIMHDPLPADADRKARAQAILGIGFDSPAVAKAVTFLKEHKTVVDPTIALFEFLTATTAKPPASFEPGAADVAPELAEQLTDVEPPSERTEMQEKAFEKELGIIGILHHAGIPIVAGTDQTVPGHSLHREIELYVQAGFTPMEAIQSATLVPARVMGVENQTGTIQTGKRADLIVIDGDPLLDIRNTRNVELTIAGGKMYKSADLWRSAGFKPWNKSQIANGKKK